MILDSNLPPILETAPWMLSDGGALDVDRCPDCWERRAHIERYTWACRVCTGMRVLDFGCGVGYGSEMLAAAGNSVTAVDTSEFALALAEEFHPGPMYLPTIPSKYPFDACVAFEVLEHLDDPQHFIDTVPARHLIVSVPVRVEQDNPHHKQHFTSWRMRAMLLRRFLPRSCWQQTEPYHWDPSIVIFHMEER
jgi:SAM-dependent methyltransferase